MPGMYAVTSIWLVRRTRAILRRAEFGFFGVMVRTWRQTPRFCGAPGIDTWRWRRLFQFLRMAGALIFEILRLRPWRTSWLIVGTKTLLLEVGRLIHPVVADRPVPGVGAAGGGRRTGCVGGFERWVTAHAPRADPSRGHEGGVYQRPDERVKRPAGRRWLVSGGLGQTSSGVFASSAASSTNGLAASSSAPLEPASDANGLAASSSSPAPAI